MTNMVPPGAGPPPSPTLIDPTAFVRIMLDKVQKKHQTQMEPWFRGTVSSYDSTGKAFVVRTGQAVADPQPYSYLGVLPLLGSDVYVVRVNGGKPVIVSPVANRDPNFYCWRSTSQPITNNATEPLSFDVFRLDTHFGQHFLSSDLTRFRPQVNGVYLLGANTQWDASAGTSNVGRRLTSIVKNGIHPWTGGSAGKIIARTAWDATDSDNTQNVWGMDYLTTADWINITVFQNSGATLNIDAAGLSTTGTPYVSSFWGVYVAPPPYWL